MSDLVSVDDSSRADAGRDPSDFARLLGQERYRASMSQRQLAEAAGCSRQYVEQLESGRRTTPSAKTVRGLARALRLHGEARDRFFDSAGVREQDAFVAPPSFDELHQLAVSTIGGLRYPAAVLVAPYRRVSAWNELMWPVFRVDPVGQPSGHRSLLEVIFDSDFRQRVRPWRPLAALLVAEFKRDTRHLIHAPEYVALMSRLRRLPDLSELMRETPSASRGAASTVFTLKNPELGSLRLRAIVTRFPESLDLEIVNFVPEDDATSRILASLSTAEAVR
jgi:transcriptional regulator with XRE-family HTH domain